MRLYHFINADYAVEAVGLRRLKISRLDKLNDPFEMFAGTGHMVNLEETGLFNRTLAAFIQRVESA